MYSPIGHQTTRIIPEPTEIKMKTAGIERLFRRRSEPHLVINSLWRHSIWYNGRGFHPSLVAPYLYRTDITELSGMNKINRIPEMLLATLPLTNLHNAVRFFLRGNHCAAFTNRVTNRFFNIYIFTGFACGNHDKSMPVVGRSDDHC